MSFNLHVLKHDQIVEIIWNKHADCLLFLYRIAHIKPIIAVLFSLSARAVTVHLRRSDSRVGADFFISSITFSQVKVSCEVLLFSRKTDDTLSEHKQAISLYNCLPMHFKMYFLVSSSSRHSLARENRLLRINGLHILLRLGVNKYCLDFFFPRTLTCTNHMIVIILLLMLANNNTTIEGDSLNWRFTK